MNLDELDIQVLKENFDEEIIKELDINNVAKIYKYLVDNGIYYAKDLLLESLDLFLLPKEEFITKFEKAIKSENENTQYEGVIMIGASVLLFKNEYNY